MIKKNTFALIGVGGYVAPRHMKAIHAVRGDLIAAVDPKDSVGIMDSHFPDARFFVEFERFDRHIDKLRRSGTGVDYISICSPNYLHDAHCRFALRSDAHAICEKPLVLNPWNLDGLAELQQDTGKQISTILQLRLHPAIEAL
ncbi:MAG: Gfo/Idh/MocA family oxidoreductase, partial [Pseudomonadota bacterium]